MPLGVKEVDAEVGSYDRQDMVSGQEQRLTGKEKADLSPRVTGGGDDLKGAMARPMPGIREQGFIGLDERSDPREIQVKLLQGIDEILREALLPAENPEAAKHLFRPVLIAKGLGVGLGKINPGAADFLQSASQTAMIGMVMGQKDPVDVGHGPSDLLQGTFQC